MTNYTTQLECHQFTGDQPGPQLVVTARIHGDEPSGEVAIRRLIDELHVNDLLLTRGKLILVPVVNPLAKEKNLRGVWGDTNRNLTKRAYPYTGGTPEDKIRASVLSVLATAQFDAKYCKRPWHFLDLHSVPLPGHAHAIVCDEKQDWEAARILGTDTIYSGWREALLNVDEADLRALDTTREAYRDYTSALVYAARDLGAATSVCLEAGQNDDPASVQRAYAALRNSLAYCGLTDEVGLPFTCFKQPEKITFSKVLIRRDESEQLVGIDIDAESVRPGQVILKGATREVCVPQREGDSWIIAHPIPNAAVGRHFGFLAKQLG